jgi:5-methylcytosine-specific restriction protein A
MPSQPCLEAGCPNLASYRGRCAEHAGSHANRNRAGRKIYSTRRWAILRRRKLRLNPICERCDKRLATDVHHRAGVENDPWSLAGLEALCRSCHSSETATTIGLGR